MGWVGLALAGVVGSLPESEVRARVYKYSSEPKTASEFFHTFNRSSTPAFPCTIGQKMPKSTKEVTNTARGYMRVSTPVPQASSQALKAIDDLRQVLNYLHQITKRVAVAVDNHTECTLNYEDHCYDVRTDAPINEDDWYLHELGVDIDPSESPQFKFSPQRATIGKFLDMLREILRTTREQIDVLKCGWDVKEAMQSLQSQIRRTCDWTEFRVIEDLLRD